MSEAKHTPGPWEAVTECPGRCCWHIQPVGNERGGFGYINGPEMSEADARLVASAPDLLNLAFEFEAFAEAAMNDASEEGDETSRVTWERRMLNARAAIARATGKAGAA